MVPAKKCLALILEYTILNMNCLYMELYSRVYHCVGRPTCQMVMEYFFSGTSVWYFAAQAVPPAARLLCNPEDSVHFKKAKHLAWVHRIISEIF